MIPTNQFRLRFDHAAIAQRFLILEAERDSGDYRRSLVPDLALQVGRALAVAYDWGESCYILYDRAKADRSLLKAALEAEAGDVRVREISSAELEQKRASLLAQLLCNAMPALGTGEQMYHNLTGRLYYHDPSWRRGKPESPRCLWALRVEFTWDGCIKLSVTTFSAAERGPKNQGEPQYLFDSQSYSLRRLVRQDPDRNTPRFFIGSLDPGRKNTVPFLEFGSLEAFRRCKVGVLQRFLEDAARLLHPYLTLDMCRLQEEAHRGVDTMDSQMEKIRSRLREAPVYVEDTVGNDESAALAALLRQELQRHSGIPLLEGTPGKGDTLFRIVHNKEFYENCPEQDPYKSAPAHCAVQHLTVEDFRLDSRVHAGKSGKEAAALRKVLQELAIKRDVWHGKMTCFDWSRMTCTAPVNFVIIPEEYRRKDAVLQYRRLRVTPDGTLEYSQWEDRPFWEDAEKEKIADAFRNRKGKWDRTVEGLVYQDPDAIQIIRTTERYTLPDAPRLQAVLAQTRDTEWLDVEPLAGAVRALLNEAPQEERQALELICCGLSQLAPQVTRKQLRECLRLRTSLGRRVNEEIFARTGVLIGSGLKQKEMREKLFGGALDIRLFAQGNAQYYYSGFRGSSLHWSLARACRIRQVTASGGTPDFARYLPLMEVDFVRASGWTVLPFPFKYLREWKP